MVYKYTDKSSTAKYSKSNNIKSAKLIWINSIRTSYAYLWR
jgi:hypothetical protein